MYDIEFDICLIIVHSIFMKHVMFSCTKYLVTRNDLNKESLPQMLFIFKEGYGSQLADLVGKGGEIP